MKPSFEDEITMKVKGIVSNSIFSKIRVFEANGSVWKIADDSIAYGAEINRKLSEL